MKRKTKVVKIYSKNNEFQRMEILKRNRVKRSKHKKFFVEGVNLINLALEHHWKIDTFAYSYENKLSSWAKNILIKSNARKHLELPRSLMGELSDKENTSELLAIIDMKKEDLDRVKISKDLLIVVIDRASSPGNLGTIIRSCDSFAVDAVFMTGHSVDLYDPKTIRASVGTIFSLPIIKLESHNDVLPWIEKVKSEIGNFSIIGTTVKTSKDISNTSFETPLMLLIGNETFGLSIGYKEACDKLVKIPIGGAASSLNVACATSIFLYEINRQRTA